MRVLLAIAVLACALPAAVPAAGHGARASAPTIYLVSPGDRRLHEVVEDSAGDGPPLALSWTPDGRSILYDRFSCDGCAEMRLLRVTPHQNGLGVVVGTGHASSLGADGKTVVFVGDDGGLSTMRLGGHAVRHVLPGGPGAAAVDQPRLSPDGRRIVFAREQRDGTWSIETIAARGGHVRRLTPTGLSTANPAWSPDGRTIAFAAQGPDGRWRIELMRADGKDLHLLPASRGSDSFPTWSPDGRKIAFVHQKGNRHVLDVAALAGRGVRRLTPPSLDAIQPSWSPKGDRIAFVCNSPTAD